MIAHPEIPSCADCQAFMYDKSWERSKSLGQPVKRPAGAPTPCYRCPKSEDGTPNPAAELSAKNWRAYNYFRLCCSDATLLLPRDRLVLKNNSMIQLIEERLGQAKSSSDLARVVLAAMGGRG